MRIFSAHIIQRISFYLILFLAICFFPLSLPFPLLLLFFPKRYSIALFFFFRKKRWSFFLTLSSFFFFFFIFFLYSLVYQPHRFKLCGKIRECLTVSTRPMQVIFRTLTQLAGLQATKTFSLLDVTESDKVYPTG